VRLRSMPENIAVETLWEQGVRGQL
jgi:hypothetical protein